jgi:hypothetical protein
MVDKKTVDALVQHNLKHEIPEHKTRHWWNRLSDYEKKAVHDVFVANPRAPIELMTIGVASSPIIGSIFPPAIGVGVGVGSVLGGFGLWGKQTNDLFERRAKAIKEGRDPDEEGEL